MADNNLGDSLRAKGPMDEAFARCRTAIELNPNNAWAHNDLGSVLAGKGRMDEAIDCFKKAITLDPKCSRPISTWALRCFARASWTRPSPSAGRPSNSTRRCLPSTHNLGLALTIKSQVDEAIACYHKAIELNPKDAFAHKIWLMR